MMGSSTFQWMDNLPSSTISLVSTIIMIGHSIFQFRDIAAVKWAIQEHWDGSITTTLESESRNFRERKLTPKLIGTVSENPSRSGMKQTPQQPSSHVFN